QLLVINDAQQMMGSGKLGMYLSAPDNIPILVAPPRRPSPSPRQPLCPALWAALSWKTRRAPPLLAHAPGMSSARKLAAFTGGVSVFAPV
ncbi:hypothetical protein ACWDCL_22055, partial [Streptomyces sp. NPDC001009]